MDALLRNMAQITEKTWKRVRHAFRLVMAFLASLNPLAILATIVLAVWTLVEFGRANNARLEDASARRGEQIVRAWQLVASLPSVVQFTQTHRANVGLKSALETISQDGFSSFANINLSGGWVANVKLPENTNLQWSFLADVTLSGAWLRGAKFYRSILINGDLAGACLAKANFEEAKLQSVIFRNADLRAADFRNASFGKLADAYPDTTLEGADISGADFRMASGLQQHHIDQACADPKNPPWLPPKVTRPPECKRKLTICSRK